MSFDQDQAQEVTMAATDMAQIVAESMAMRAALLQARKWIRDVMLDPLGCPQERIDNPSAGSHLANINAALGIAGDAP